MIALINNPMNKLRIYFALTLLVLSSFGCANQKKIKKERLILKTWRKDKNGCITKQRTDKDAWYIMTEMDIRNKDVKYIIKKLGKPDSPNLDTVDLNKVKCFYYYYESECNNDKKNGKTLLIVFHHRVSVECFLQ